jgi:predicted DNA-binding transcriptional regulator AlpA
MSAKLNPEEVATVIKARKILNAQDLAPDTNVKTICQVAGISRKTGYQWANKSMESSNLEKQMLHEELEQLRSQHEDLKKRFDDVDFENEGRKLAWEIHEIDKMLAEKKSTMNKTKKKKR